MGIWGVVQIIGVAWFAASVVIAIAWALVGRRIFRKPPQPEFSERMSDPDGGA